MPHHLRVAGTDGLVRGVARARSYYEHSGLERITHEFFDELGLGMRGELIEWESDLPVVTFGTHVTTERYTGLRRCVRMIFSVEEGLFELLATASRDTMLYQNTERIRTFVIAHLPLPLTDPAIPALAGLLEVAWRTVQTMEDHDLLIESAWADEIEMLESSWRELRGF